MNSYPLILYPLYIESALNAKPPISPFMEEPPKLPFYYRKSFIFIILALALIGISYIVGFSNLVLFLIILGALIQVFYYLKFINFSIFNLFNNLTLKYKKIHSKYNQKYQEYLRRKEEHERQERQKKHTSKNITNHRKKLILETLNNVTYPKEHIDFTQPKKGATEDYFYRYLDYYFGQFVKTGLKLEIPNFDYPYTPDFVYKNQEWNLYIDIEIDEPYVLNTGQPIHYNDSRRNQFFLERNWIIIRFAEEQICRYPKSCCKTINNVIKEITGHSHSNSLDKIAELPKISCWGYTEALEMAENNYRNNYL